jgi:hypothetical protein
MRVLLTLTRYGETGEGDVTKLTDREGLHRLRVGKWRFCSTSMPDVVRIQRIYHRGQPSRAGDGATATRNPIASAGTCSKSTLLIHAVAMRTIKDGGRVRMAH